MKNKSSFKRTAAAALAFLAVAGFVPGISGNRSGVMESAIVASAAGTYTFSEAVETYEYGSDTETSVQAPSETPTDGVETYTSSDSSVAYILGDTIYLKKAGTAVITYSVTGASDPEENGTGSYTIRVAPKEIDVEWSDPVYAKYDGTEIKPTFEVDSDDIESADIGRITLTVTVDGTGAGSHIATASITGECGENYKISSSTAKYVFEVEKGDPTAADFEFVSSHGGVYPANGVTGMGGLTVKYQKGDETPSTVRPTEPGSYKVSVDVDGTGMNYNAKSGITDSSWIYTVSGGETKPDPDPEPDPGTTPGKDVKAEYTITDSSVWDDVKAAVESKKFGTVTVNMNGADTVPEKVMSALSGKNVYLKLIMANGDIWTVNGTSVASFIGSVDFGVTNGTSDIPSKLIDAVSEGIYSRQFKLDHSGKYGCSPVLTIYVGSSYSGKYAWLYYYNRAAGKLEYVSSNTIKSSGYADFLISHASDYVIIVTKKPYSGYVPPVHEVPVVMPVTTTTVSSTPTQYSTYEYTNPYVYYPYSVITTNSDYHHAATTTTSNTAASHSVGTSSNQKNDAIVSIDSSGDYSVITADMGISGSKVDSHVLELNGNSAFLSWNREEGAKSYTIYRKNSVGDYVEFKKSASNTTTIDNLKNGEKYILLVKANMADGSQKIVVTGKYSFIASFKPVVKAKYADGKVKLSWKKVAGAEAYRVYRISGTSKALIGVTKTTKASVSVEGSGRYYYAVSAYANGSWTSVKKADVVGVNVK